MRYTYLDKKYAFSPSVQAVLDVIGLTMLGWDDREATYTGPEYDRKTPFLDVFEEMPDAPYSEALAHAIVKSWNDGEIFVLPNELIVGNVRPKRHLFEHFAHGIVYEGGLLDEDEYPDYPREESEIASRVNALKDRLWPATKELLDIEADRLGIGRELFRKGWEQGLTEAGGYQGHTVPNYPKLFSLGFDGTIELINAYAANTADPQKLELYHAMKVIVEGLSRYAELHAEKAECLAEAESNAELRERYLLVAANCRSIAHKAPSTYFEAVQLMWFYALWDWADCLGRIDQNLWPFYKSSDDTPVRRDDVTACLLFKLREHGVHNITLGGVRPEDGSDATNELTYLILQILRTCHDTHPRASVRIHDDTPEELMQLIVKMWSEGMSDPTVVSDTLVIDGLRRYGVTLSDARDYTMLGCQEIEIPGKSNFGCEDGAFNLAKAFEITLFDGFDRRTGMQFGLHTGRLTDFNSVEDVWDAFEKQIKYITPIFLKLCDAGQVKRDKVLSKLVKSIYTDDCIERGINMDAGGAKYNYGVVETAGLAVVADSFTALETVVFRDKKVSLEDLVKALEANYKGFEDLRKIMLDAPKFGNDDDTADKWAVRVLEMFWGELGRHRSVRGGKFMGACSLQSGGNTFGQPTLALPDGHVLGQSLGNTIGPRSGADKSGLTAMLKSVMKLPLHLGLGGTSLNVTIPVTENASEEQRAKISRLVRTYLKCGGQMAQVTTAKLEDLLDAMVNPTAHYDLIVRVGGYSAKFVDLMPTSKVEMISRYGVSI